MKKSLTYDNGAEMAQHKLFTKTLKYKFILLTLTAHGKGQPMKTATA